MRSSLRGLGSGGFVVPLLAMVYLAVLSACPPQQTTSSGLVTVHYRETFTMQFWRECYTGLGFSGPSSYAVYVITEIDNSQPHAADFTLHLPFIYASTDPTAAHNQDVPGSKMAGNWFSHCNTLAPAVLPTASDLSVEAGAVLKPTVVNNVASETFIVGLSPDVETGPDVTGLNYNYVQVPGLHILMENDTGQNATFCATGTNATGNSNTWVCVQ